MNLFTFCILLKALGPVYKDKGILPYTVLGMINAFIPLNVHEILTENYKASS